MPDSGKDIDKAKQKAIDALNARIDEMGRAAYSIMLQSIEDTFDFKSGKIQGGKNFIKQLNKLTVDVLNLIQSEPKFTGPVSQFIKRMQPISDAITDFQKSTNGIKVPDFEIAKKIVLDEIVDKMLNNGLNQHFVQPLRDLIYQNVTGGLSLSDARTQIKEFIQAEKEIVKNYTAFRYGKEGGEVMFSSKNMDYSEQYAKLKGGTIEDVRQVSVIARKPLIIDLSPKEFSSPAAEKKYIEQGIKAGNDVVIFRDLVNGDEFYAEIKANKIDPGKLGKYVEQTAQQAVDSYAGSINTKLLENFDYDGLLITGSLIDNSSKQCRFAIEELGGKITRENWSKVEAIGKKQSGWIEGTTFDNLPMNRLHWGCRHSFYPIILKKTA